MSDHIEKNVYIYLVIAMLFWGLSWPASKILTTYTDSYTLTFLKFFLSSLSMIPLLLFNNQKFEFSSKIIKYLLFSTLFLILYNILFFVALRVGYAGFGGMLVTGSNPIFTFLLIALLERVKIPKQKKIALILGIVGTLIMLEAYRIDLVHLLSGGNALFLISSLAWSIVTIINTNAKKYIGTLAFTFYLYMASSVVSYLFLTSNEQIIAIFEQDYIFWLNLIFTTVFTTGFATTFYFKASTIIGANQASSFIFLVPVVAVVSSNVLLGEVPTISTLIGGVLMIYALWLINKK